MNGNRPDLSSIQGIHRFVDQVTPDSSDGIHWTEAGYTAEANLLRGQLSQREAAGLRWLNEECSRCRL
jgi:hypothetical protein